MKGPTKKIAAWSIVFALLCSSVLALRASAAPPPGESAPVGGPVTSSAMTALTLAGFERALHDGRLINGYLAWDVVLTLGDTGEQVRGREAVIAVVEELIHVAFAGSMNVNTRIISGSVAAISGELIGRQVGVYQEVNATGRTIRVPYVAIFEVVNGEITSLRLDFSSAEIMRQLATPSTENDDFPNRSGRPF